MTEQEPQGDLFDIEMEATLHKKLAEYHEMVEGVDSTWSRDDVSELLTEANGVIKIICGDDTDLYEYWRYRMFITKDGTVTVLQGIEVATEIPAKYGDARLEDGKPKRRGKKK